MRYKNITSKVLFLFIILAISYASVQAQGQGPNSPEASTFEPIDAADMVNLTTGDLSYVLPLLEVPGPEGGYPLALSYHSGIAMGQEASWVGLGWNLNPGAINRSLVGVPDDWRGTKKYRTVYDKGGVITSYTGSISVGWGDNNFYSAGIQAQYSSNKTFGGENSYRFDIGITGSATFRNSGLGINGSLGTNGASLGGSYYPNGFNEQGEFNDGVGVGISVSQSFVNGSTSIGASVRGVGGNVANSSLGISFNTKGTSSINSNAGSFSLSGSKSSANGLSFKNDGFTIPIRLFKIGVNINLGYQRNRHWLFDNDYTIYNGSLYSGDFNNQLENNLFEGKIALDSYQSINPYNRLNEITDTNFSFMSYDQYNITGQGISGAIQPQIFQEGVLRHQREVLTSGEDGYENASAYYFYPENTTQGAFSKKITDNSLHFYFQNENASFLKVTSNAWNAPNPGGSHTPFSFNTTGQQLQDNILINGVNNDGYHEATQRKRSGSYIEVFTNDQIISALQGSNGINFIEAKGIARDNNFPEDGIGGYRVTTADGKVYHYSLPVYQKERFSKSTDLDKDINLNFYEEAQLESYATHWLLTAITGPDYIDINNDNTIDEGDYGYWVEFEYGKWSDGFSWRTPVVNDFEKNLYTKQFEWGVKEIYYLDKIRTKTHTALFIKEERKDNLASTIQINNGNNVPKIYKDVLPRSFIKGSDGNYYVNGMYDVSDFSLYDVTQLQYYTAKSEHSYLMQTNPHKLLKLKKIILLKNEDANISKNNSSQQSSIFAGKIDIRQKHIVHYLGQLISTPDKVIIDNKEWQGEFYGNVLDTQDILNNMPNLEQNALKIIDLNQDYSLMPNSPNSSSATKAKLSLNSVKFRGKSGVDLVPPYTFEYNNPNSSYDNEYKDSWGYAKNNPMAWSLQNIQTPTGQVLEMLYEEDQFSQEAAITNFIFDDKLEIRFTGTSSGEKRLQMRNHPDNLPGQNINFTQYFEIGEQAEVDVLVWLHPDHNGGHRVADVAKSCQVSSVSSNLVEFILPSGSTNSDVRRGENCYKKDWVRYQHYSQSSNDGIVELGWERKIRENSCEDPGSGNRKVRYSFRSNKSPINNGGGIRVKELSIVDGTDKYTTSYDYNVPNSSVSSGITSYEPSKLKKEVLNMTELPGPGVLYKNVTVTKKDKLGNPYMKDIYEFNVLSSVTINQDGFEMGSLLKLQTVQDTEINNVLINNENSQTKFSKFNLIDNLSAVGALISKKTYNSENQLLSQTKNTYKTISEIDQGIIEETFKVYKKIDGEHYNDYFFSSSSKTSYPSVLKSTNTTEGGYTINTSLNKYDFLNGNVLESETTTSKGIQVKNSIVPAYYKYPEMGSKVDNVLNKNMLSQEAVNYTFINKNNSWQPIGVGITTWNDNWTYRNTNGTTETPTASGQKIWRTHKSYIWDGTTNADGTYLNYEYSATNDDDFNWNNPNATQPAPWKQISETTLYDHYSMPLEIKDINNNYASTKMWDRNTKVYSTSNAKYTEHFSSNAEVIENGYVGDGILLSNGTQTQAKSHTGVYGIQLNNNQTTFSTTLKAGEHKTGTYRVSVWAYKDNYENVRVTHNGTTESFNAEIILAGNWVQLNHTLNLQEVQQEQISITTTANNTFVDDYRLYPIASSVTAYVYNAYDELEAMLGGNNLATKYQYDAAGRLIRVYQEVADTPTITGGFKRAAEYRYNYARATETTDDSSNGNTNDSDTSVYFGNIQSNANANPTTATLYGPPGAQVTMKIEIDCISSGFTSTGVAALGNDVTTISCGELVANRTITIPTSGTVQCSIDQDNTNGDPSDKTTVTIISTSSGAITPNANSFEDVDSF